MSERTRRYRPNFWNCRGGARVRAEMSRGEAAFAPAQRLCTIVKLGTTGFVETILNFPRMQAETYEGWRRAGSSAPLVPRSIKSLINSHGRQNWFQHVGEHEHTLVSTRIVSLELDRYRRNPDCGGWTWAGRRRMLPRHKATTIPRHNRRSHFLVHRRETSHRRER